jgi:hypothetical protein
MRASERAGTLDAMVSAPERTALRRYGRVLVLLALQNELRGAHAPRWRRERLRLEIDRAIAELAWAQSRDEAVTDAFRPPP